ncbi:Bestrophin, RFP-TM, chloride channel-domain-containing protein [Mycena rebaudengoi]|nr:Bestrophin, RFP-TM, chloride channel-domain-containing protein [Mycena rebaudengoi]
MAPNRLQGKRSSTGLHNLKPGVKPSVATKVVPEVPTFTRVAWTFGRGAVLWRIWPATLMFTLFAAGVVYFYDFMGGHEGTFKIPNVMLTVLGVVIGFVISYRAMSGYDRYWMGRAAWSDIIRNSRTMGRLIWYHVPARLTVKTEQETISGKIIRSPQELSKAMAEKRMALDLVQAFAVALKHHIRGELGIYYDDLYDLVRPLHDHGHTAEQQKKHDATRSPRQIANPRMTSASHLPQAQTPPPPSTSSGPPKGPALLPAGNIYGTFDGSRNGSRTSLRHHLRRSPSEDSVSSVHHPLLPGNIADAEQQGMPEVAQTLIPFAGLFSSIRSWFQGKKQAAVIPSHNTPPERKWGGPIHPDVKLMKLQAQIGENLPEEILRCISEWCSVLEDRNTVPGGSLGGIMGGIAAFEANLATLEHILTTPLPFVFAVHIRHTVWLYLFLLPFQLVSDFGWHTVPAVFVGTFIYLGFMAAGDEIEQPFGYDDNDLDLDMFCQDIIAEDIASLKTAPCLNAYLGPEEPTLIRHRSMTLTEATARDEYDDISDVEA